MKKLTAPVCVLVLSLIPWQSARAGIDSLWTDDATLHQQLIQLIQIHHELNMVSDGIMATRDATRDIVDTYDFIRSTVEEVQAYGPQAFWADFKRDFYNQYPGFELLEGHSQLSKWKGSRTASPPEMYQLISAVFGDLTEDVRKREQEGQINTTALRLEQFEGAGALALAHEAETATKDFDADVRHLYAQAAQARTGEEANVVTAKATLVVAAQNSHIIRLLSRGVRLDGVDAAIAYGQRVESLNAAARVSAEVGAAASELSKPPRLMKFAPLFGAP